MESCRNIIAEKGISALNMRTVAQRCNIAPGSLYNYFPSKEELIMQAVESVWRNIFNVYRNCKRDASFIDYVQCLFRKLKIGMQKYPNFFTAHSAVFTGEKRNKAREKMQCYLSDVKTGMLEVLKADTNIADSVFSRCFTESDFTDFILETFVSALIQQKGSCKVLIELLRKTLYP